MATSKKNPKKVTTAKGWKKSESTSDSVPHELELPSGNVCLIKRPGMQAFLKDGIIPNALIKPIMATVEANDPRKSEAAADDMAAKLLSDPEKLADMFTLVDNVTLKCVVEPTVLPVPEEGEDRDPEALYIDQLDQDDKMFIFSYTTGGSSDLARFRATVAGHVSDSEDGGEVQLPAE